MWDRIHPCGANLYHARMLCATMTQKALRQRKIWSVTMRYCSNWCKIILLILLALPACRTDSGEGTQPGTVPVPAPAAVPVGEPVFILFYADN